MNSHIPVAIVGGGASGLFAGSILGKKALILERGDKCGRKLLLTGGGRCNYTHSSTLPELLDHYNGNKRFISHALYSFTPDDIISFFSKLGIEPKEEENGKIFPLNKDSYDIVSALEKRSCIETNTYVLDIKKEDKFIITTNKGTITSDYLILSTGGNSYPHTGSDGNGYKLASSLGHNLTPLKPALAPLALNVDMSKAEGITIPLTIKIKKKEYTGSTVITKKGISGPLAEDISYMISDDEDITIKFIDIDFKELRQKNGKPLLKNALMIPERLSIALLEDLANKRIADISKKEELYIEERLCALRCKAKALQAGAMSTHGGVDIRELDPKTMESKLIEGLYLVGDIVDVDANCGGYSLTWAFASSYIASHNILKSL